MNERKRPPILFFHNDDTCAEMFTFILESKYNFDVEEVCSATEVSLITEDTSLISLIIFDESCDKSELDETLNIISSYSGGSIPTLFFGDLSDFETYKSNFHEFLEKEDLGNTLDKIMDKYFQQAPKTDEDEYVRITLKALKHLEGISEDVYIQLISGRYLKLFCTGDKITQDDVDRYLKKEVTHLHLKKDVGVWILKNITQNFDEVINAIKSNGTFALKPLPSNKYVPVRLSTLAPGPDVNFNLFSKTDDEYINVDTTDGFSKEVKALVKSQGHKTLYIKDVDEKAYQDYLSKNLNKLVKSKGLDDESKAEAIQSVAQKSVEDTYDDVSKENVAQLQELCTVLFDYIEKGDINSVKALLEQKQNQSVYCHVVNVATMALSIFDTIKKYRESKDEEKEKLVKPLASLDTEDQTRTIIGLSALMHDVGKEYGEEEKHPEIGANMMLEISDNAVYQKISEVILQHEEFCDGTGYPGKLHKSSLSVMSQIIQISNYYDKMRSIEKLSKRDTLGEITDNERMFNKYLIKVFKKIDF